jgi:hypothetical protein
MICPANSVSSTKKPKVPKWHQEFLVTLPKIRRHAAMAFRHLRPEAREEAVQEVVANSWRAYVRLVELNKVDLAYPTVLARYGVKQTRDHRRVGGSPNDNYEQKSQQGFHSLHGYKRTSHRNVLSFKQGQNFPSHPPQRKRTGREGGIFAK